MKMDGFWGFSSSGSIVSALGSKARPSSCTLTLMGAPLRTTRVLEPLKPSVRALNGKKCIVDLVDLVDLVAGGETPEPEGPRVKERRWNALPATIACRPLYVNTKQARLREWVYVAFRTARSLSFKLLERRGLWLLQAHAAPSRPMVHHSCPKPSVSSMANMSFSFSCS
ncbi:hypothetical protein EYF80_011081 [Liparis tanakae]|uniref:Uncharacterized protein n=1 Tax=Liparis tanakae TaxID=230148 RepID=A0A4Z2ILN5_9TELE|nr:hypothetical protein EYF80_011081 [Liparis tanakae]